MRLGHLLMHLDRLSMRLDRLWTLRDHLVMHPGHLSMRLDHLAKHLGRRGYRVPSLPVLVFLLRSLFSPHGPALLIVVLPNLLFV